jgi:hypothetical protein
MQHAGGTATLTPALSRQRERGKIKKRERGTLQFAGPMKSRTVSRKRFGLIGFGT